jgi:nitrogen fixation/metabolism regulation signal transduction histidine kinase
MSEDITKFRENYNNMQDELKRVRHQIAEERAEIKMSRIHLMEY